MRALEAKRIVLEVNKEKFKKELNEIYDKINQACNKGERVIFIKYPGSDIFDILTDELFELFCSNPPNGDLKISW